MLLLKIRPGLGDKSNCPLAPRCMLISLLSEVYLKPFELHIRTSIVHKLKDEPSREGRMYVHKYSRKEQPCVCLLEEKMYLGRYINESEILLPYKFVRCTTKCIL